MRKIFSSVLVGLMFLVNSGIVFAIQEVGAQTPAKPVTYKQDAPVIRYAFVFDGPSDKNEAVLKQFQNSIVNSTAPDYKANFPKELIYEGNWKEDNIKSVCDKALSSNASMVVSLGYLSSKYLSELQDKKKFVVTIDQYGLRDMSDDFFNPVQQSIQGIKVFNKLVNFKKAAILMNENYYKIRKDWNATLTPKLEGIDFTIISVGQDIDAALAKIPSDCDAVVLTPLFNLSSEKRKTLIDVLNNKKLYTYSTLGKEDVDMGALIGTGAYDLDRKLAEATSFNIKGILKGEKIKQSKVEFYEDEIIYFNKDTAQMLNYQPHLRVLNTAQVITQQKLPTYNLSVVFDELDAQNLDIERKRLLVRAAKNASLSAMLKYLPTFATTVGLQKYNYDYAHSSSSSIPEKMGSFQMGLEQMIYSPTLVTNILIKHKAIDFSKAEQFLTEQNMGLDVALLYINTLMLENAVELQREAIKEARDGLAMSRVREKNGASGKEETLRWAAQMSILEQQLLNMESDLKNVKLAINKVLARNLGQDFNLDALTSSDPAFYTKDLHVIDYVGTEKGLEAFTQMITEEALTRAPELAKLRAAIKMKDYEIAMYYQKFLLPDAKLNLDYTSLADRDWTGPSKVHPNATNLRFGMFAQWKPIEGGTKFAEIARIKAEKEELQRYSDEIEHSMEEHIRSTINKAVAAYFSIKKNHIALATAQESLERNREIYTKGKCSQGQMIDSQKTYISAKLAALNSQYVFFNELVWVQRAICSVNWNKATPESKAFIERVKTTLELNLDPIFL